MENSRKILLGDVLKEDAGAVKESIRQASLKALSDKKMARDKLLGDILLDSSYAEAKDATRQLCLNELKEKDVPKYSNTKEEVRKFTLTALSARKRQVKIIHFMKIAACLVFSALGVFVLLHYSTPTPVENEIVKAPEDKVSRPEGTASTEVLKQVPAIPENKMRGGIEKINNSRYKMDYIVSCGKKDCYVKNSQNIIPRIGKYRLLEIASKADASITREKGECKLVFASAQGEKKYFKDGVAVGKNYY